MLRQSFFLLLLLKTLVAAAQGDQGRQQVTWDFTKPETLHEHAQWLRNDGIAAGENGLSWDLQAGEQPETWAQRTIHLRSRQPIPVGWSWRPATEVRLEAEIKPADAFRLFPRKWLYGGETGILYVRYSAEAHNWSSWHPLTLQRPSDGDHGAVVLAGALSVPEVAQHSYRELLREAPRQPVTRFHAGLNEEAAVEWIVDRQPDFFARELPFIGYVEFLWELQLRPQQQIKQLKIDISYPRSMRVQPPAGHDWTKPWRFRSEDAADQTSAGPPG